MLRHLSIALVISLLPASCIAVSTQEHFGYETKLEVVALQNASANDVANSLRDLLRSESNQHTDVDQTLHVAVDERTNSILLRGPEKQVKEAREAVMRLDSHRENE
jgi:type II secretory pathway component GspD/PulD (secretin)